MGVAWRVLYRMDADAILVLDVFPKKTPRTPDRVLQVCRQRLAKYDTDVAGG